MKKVLVLLAAATLLSSCGEVTKCKCTFEAGNLTLKEQVISKPDDVNCSEITIEDFDGDIIDIDFSKIATVKCVNYYED